MGPLLLQLSNGNTEVRLVPGEMGTNTWHILGIEYSSEENVVSFPCRSILYTTNDTYNVMN